MTTNQTFQLLLLQDDDVDATVVKRLLKKDTSRTYTVAHAKRLSAALELVNERDFDLILSDLSLPDSDGPKTIESLRKFCREIPIVALTGYDDEDFGSRLIRCGASDYIPKDQLSKMILVKSINYSTERIRFGDIERDNELLEIKNQRLGELYQMSQQFVDNVSHEFRTPLTVIRECASIIRDEIDGPICDQQRDRLNSLINRADDLSSMVDDLLDTSCLESGLIRTWRCENELSKIVKQVHRMLRMRAEAKQITINVEEIPDDLIVFCDDEKLRRVLINLMVNAIKFTPKNGQVNILVRKLDEHRIEVVVSDNGPGIPKTDLEAIFERFKKLDSHNRMSSCKGFGLGLSIARSLAWLNLGELRVQSEEGKGSQFSVLIPLAKMEAVLNCYAEQRCNAIVNDGNVTVTEVQVDVDGLDDDRLEAVDEFLRSSVKSFDLTYRESETCWAICSCTTKAESRQMYSRLNTEWDELRRNCFGPPLPNLTFTHRRSVVVPEQKERLLACASRSESLNLCSTESEVVIEYAQPGSRILIVEDEAELASVLEARLGSAGYQITTALDGVSGIEKAVATTPDLIILDVRMPRLDGQGVLKRLRDTPSTQRTPIIVISGSLADQDLVLDNGANLFIRKPYKSEQVVAAIKHVLQESSVEADQSQSEFLSKSLLNPPLFHTLPHV